MDFPALKIGFFSALEKLFTNGAVLGLQLASNAFRTTVRVGFSIPATVTIFPPSFSGISSDFCSNFSKRLITLLVIPFRL